MRSGSATCWNGWGVERRPRAGMTHLAHGGAVLLYALAAVSGFIALRAARWPARVPWLLAAGGLLHALGFVGLHLDTPPVPLASFPAALSLMGWLGVVAYLSALGIARVHEMGAWVAVTAGLLTLGADVGLRWLGPIAPDPAGAGAWPHAHVLLSAAGISLLGLASLAGLAYLAQERALRGRRPIGQALPSLESLDRVEHLMLGLGFPLLTLGVLSGYVWGLSRGLSPWSGHAVGLLVAWAVYLSPVSRRLYRQERGHVPARRVVLSFALLTVSYVGVRLFGSAL